MKRSAFEPLEGEKENAVALVGGRSLARVVALRAAAPRELGAMREQFESRLASLDFEGDPLAVFLEYIAWIKDAVVQGGMSRASGLLEVTERCLMYCQGEERYGNDERYVRLWLEYAWTFCGDDADRRDVYVFMFRNGIGSQVAAYYDQFSKWLYAMGKTEECLQLLRTAQARRVQPENLIVRRLGQLAQSTSSDVDGTAMAQYFSESNPPTILSRRRDLLQQEHRERQLQSQSGSTRTSSSGIFRDDDDDDDTNDETTPHKGWSFLRSKRQRDKENRALPQGVIERGMNLGTLDTLDNTVSTAGKTKMAIFHDSLGRSDPVYTTLPSCDDKSEKIDCNFALVYDQDEEYSIEMILAVSRGLLAAGYCHKRRRLKPAARPVRMHT
ncbi:Mad3p KNAG_0B04970 [Huiozyma naganishii CBS 8797]|uniref:BUB1 N-terminal domain-containing protein n=1 Tax=Huiozyma naganishii (strain ATCC MYA-139 / BCRC 22969 / CBS 8797 / KCTC 17520 / NBRC 10181 / NCYC 3082 / Yp74L-3) TaxID=1071383 RepID=J7S521_HUIN7|nr:hypothetical protein KNAG_0B04970 [Kazachstania naganishii CBS 8797]CCK68931.1 hypothetical protein KNAG_0B04970 [Kazachstania naganishii CBS 8797]